MNRTGKTASPFVIEAIDLVGRPGSQRTVELEFPAPAGLSSDVMGLPKGENITLEVSLESVSEGIYATGHVSGTAVGECSRCLDPVSKPVRVRFDELYTYPAKKPSADEDVVLLEDDEVNLEPLVRDVVALAMPYQPLCSTDCAGLCGQCGIRMDENPGHEHEVIDDRFAALKGLFKDDQEA
ncbi:YceD family protein [Dermabacteraceae bacterium P13264]